MRLVDFYVESLLLARKLPAILESDNEISCASLQERLLRDLDSAVKAAIEKSGFDESIVKAGLFPVAAFIDELILVSSWPNKKQWKNESLQRHYFDTTNAGQEFYDRLNLLNRQGDDRSIREIYLLCLGLGFKGRYFLPDDRPNISESRLFNLKLLLPDDADNKIEKTVLFN